MRGSKKANTASPRGSVLVLAYFAAGLLLRRAYRPPYLPNYALLKSIAQIAVLVKVFSRVLDAITG